MVKDYSVVSERKVRKTAEGTYYVETYFPDGAVVERFFRSAKDAYEYVGNA